MKLNADGHDAIELIEKYYNVTWPVKDFDMSQMCCSTNGGDGSVSICWDLIDLKAKKLIRVRDFYDEECDGTFREEFGEELDGEYQTACERITTYSSEQIPSVVDVGDLISSILTSAFNYRGYALSRGRNPIDGELD